MKKFMKAFLATFLAVLIASTVSLRTLALSQKKYISEMVIETGKSADEAKSKLEKAGYTILDKNISNTENDDETYGYMYVGYKTTSNADEAITDIRLMHMGGGYSYAEYEKIIKEKTNEIDKIMSGLTSAVKEFRINYENKRQAAVVAYDILNQLKEDDSGVLLGDYFLDTSKKQSDYTKVFLQCSAAVLVTVENALAIASSATYDRGILRVSNLDKEDFIGATQYEGVATDIYNSLPSVQSSLGIYANSGLTTADGATKEQINEAFEALTDEEKISWRDSFTFAYTLENIELSDGTTLYDLLMIDLDELTTEDLYPLASVLSEGQASMINIAGLKTVITTAVMKDTDWNGINDYYYDVDEPISVYSGVDRSLFKGGVALTDKAMVEAAVNTEKTWFGSIDKETEDVFYSIIGISYCVLAGAGALYAAAKLYTIHYITTVGSTFNHFVNTEAFIKSFDAYLLNLRIFTYTTRALGYIALIALGVFLIATAIYLITVGYNYYNPTYDEIPRILVEKSTDKNDTATYTYYNAVKNCSDKIIDINQHDGPRWMSLYTTKDENAGTPILADLDIIGKNVLKDYEGVRKFSQDSAFNLNKFSYNLGFSIKREGKSIDIKESFMFYKRAAESTNYASIFSSENAILSASGLGIGVLAGILGTSIFIKKKKKVEA